MMHPQLCAPQDNDATWLLEALNDARTNHALVDLPHPYPADFIPEFWLDDTQPLLQFVWLKDHQPLGYIWFSVSDGDGNSNADQNADQNAEWSFLLHPNFQGQGLGLKYLPAIFNWLTQHMKTNFKTTNISSHTRPTNKAAQKLLTACGFTLIQTTQYPTACGEALLEKWQFNY